MMNDEMEFNRLLGVWWLTNALFVVKMRWIYSMPFAYWRFDLFFCFLFFCRPLPALELFKSLPNECYTVGIGWKKVKLVSCVSIRLFAHCFNGPRQESCYWKKARWPPAHLWLVPVATWVGVTVQRLPPMASRLFVSRCFRRSRWISHRFKATQKQHN